MAETKERMSNQGTLLGPKQASEWATWRAARDKRIREPRRLKTCKDSQTTASVPNEKNTNAG